MKGQYLKDIKNISEANITNLSQKRTKID